MSFITCSVAILIVFFFLHHFGINTASAVEIKFTPQVPLPNDPDFGPGGFDFGKEDSIRPIALYVKAIYKYMIGAVGIIAAIWIMIGGVLWLTAGGDSGKITQAKDMIRSSITGLFLSFGAFLILATINPDLVNFKTPKVERIAERKLYETNYTESCCDPQKGPISTVNGSCPSGSICKSYCVYLDGQYQCKGDISTTNICCLIADNSGATTCTNETSEASCDIKKGASIKGKVCGNFTCGEAKQAEMGCCLDSNNSLYCQQSNTDKCGDIKKGSCNDYKECKAEKGCCAYNTSTSGAGCEMGVLKSYCSSKKMGKFSTTGKCSTKSPGWDPRGYYNDSCN